MDKITQSELSRATLGAMDREENRYAVTGWGQNVPFDYALPSGQKCLLKQLEMEEILALGIVDQLDTFTNGLITKPEAPGKKTKKSTAKQEMDETAAIFELLKDKERYDQLIGTVNKVVMAGVVLPKIHDQPEDELTRKAGVAYIDQIGFMDKMSIFTQCFRGLGDTTRFHGEQAAGLGDVAEVESAEGTA